MGSLTVPQFKQLQSALLDAFRDRGQLERMVHSSLNGKNLNEIADHGGNLENDTWKLISWAESHGEISNLIKGAIEVNPGNPKLKNFYQEWKNGAGTSRIISKPTPKPPRKIVAPSPSTNLLSPRKSIDDGLGIDSVSSDKKLYCKDDAGWIVYNETIKFWCGDSSRRSCNIDNDDIDCAAVTKLEYLVEWDIESEFALGIRLHYSYQNRQTPKRVALVCDPIDAHDIRKYDPNRAIVMIEPSLVGTIDTEHVLLEYSVLEYQLTSTSNLPNIPLSQNRSEPIMKFIELGFRLRCKGLDG